MKKLLTVILILALAVPAAAFADLPDISNLSYDELVQLKDSINLAMWNSQEWQEVTVPIGVWEVGSDIPAGKWNISVTPDTKRGYGAFTYCDLLDESGLDAGNQFYCKIYHHEALSVPGDDDPRYPLAIDIELKEGTYFIVKNAPLVFTPPQGKPDLGFK